MTSPPSAALCGPMLDDAATPLAFKRAAISQGDLAELRTRPWWAIDAAGRRLLAQGVPVVWRRASISIQGSRVYDASVLRTRSRAEMQKFDDLAAEIAAAAPRGTLGPAFLVPSLSLVYPADTAGPPTVTWPTVSGFVDLMTRTWWPGWTVRRALSGEEPGEAECAWSCRLQAGRGLHDITLIAAAP